MQATMKTLLSIAFMLGIAIAAMTQKTNSYEAKL